MTCPLCRRPVAWDGNPWRPFCSERCQLTDLGTWAAEQYRLPGSTFVTDPPSSEDRQQEDQSVQLDE